MIVETTVETIATISTSPPEFAVRPAGTPIDHRDSWKLCVLDEPVAEPKDDEAIKAVNDFRERQKRVVAQAARRAGEKKAAKLARRQKARDDATKARQDALEQRLTEK